MALIKIEFHSKVLDLNTNLYVIKPNEFGENSSYKVLYLLHGYQGDYTNWVKYTNILKYAEKTNLLIVMPSGYNSFYVNSKLYGDYETFIKDEVYDLINKTFNINQTKENTFIAGLSMGGFGAIKTALAHPDRYKKAVGLSSVVDLVSIIQRVKDSLKEKTKLLLNEEVTTANNLYTLAKDSLGEVELYLACGTEDYLFKENEDFHNYLNEINYKHTYSTSPGVHNWEYWDKEIKEVLKWLLN